MSAVHAAMGIAVLATSLAAGLWGGVAWWRGGISAWFWRLLRTCQALLVVQVLLGASLLLIGREPARLHILYGVLPLAISFVAEQLRLVAADQVLQKRGMEKAREMEALPETEQQAIVSEIVARETGVMAASAIVVFLLALRASGVAGIL